jgi:RNA polymerase sigma-70 factor, ECF subfamily
MAQSRSPQPPSVLHRSPANISGVLSDVQEEALDNVRSLDPVDRLVERAKDGDKDAYGQVFRLHRDAICRFARLHLGPETDDVVAEVFTRAWVQLPQYRSTGAPFVAWLYGIARHVVADEHRRQARVEPRAELPDTLARWAEDDRLTLAAAIAKLPREQRRVIELKFLMGMRNPEVAAAMETTTNAVNAKQWRALTMLRSELEERG